MIGHNAKYEYKWLFHHGKIRCQFAWDTMIAARLLRSDLPADLKSLAARDLDVPEWDLPKGEKARIRFLPIEDVAAYCAKDCWYTLMLYRRQKECLA
jgi:DNA polymerase I-like protein with 3'-5' exonuclease and polymerase domains